MIRNLRAALTLFTCIGVLVSGQYGCSPTVAGAGSEAEGRIVAGRAVYENGDPAINSLARIRPVDFSGTDDSAIPLSFTSRTMDDGGFVFDSVPADTYLVEIIDDDSLAAAVRCTVTIKTDTLHLAAVGLDTMVSLYPRALSGPFSAGPIAFAVQGVQRSPVEGATPDTPLRLAPGTYAVLISGYYGSADSSRVVNIPVSGRTDTLKTAPYIAPCTSRADDSAVVATILAVNDIAGVGVDGVIWPDTGRITGVNLSSKRLTVLPDAIGSMSELTYLKLEKNAITDISPFIGQCSRLDTLFIGPNNLTSVPARLGDCTELTFISMGENNLQVLPEEIGNLYNLRHFSMERNRLRTLPASIGELQSLEKLYISDNMLSSIPGSIIRLEHVRILTIENNRLCTMPDSISRWIEQRDSQWEQTQVCE